MATSTEQINDLIAGNAALKAFFEAERQELVDAKKNLPALIYASYYVDEVAGNPGAAGTQGDPLDSVDAALDLVKSGQFANIYLLSDATVNKVRSYYGTTINFASGTGVTYTLTFADQATNWVDRSASFRGTDVHIKFSGAIVVQMAGGVNTNPLLDASGLCAVSLYGCQIDGAGASAVLCGLLGWVVFSLRGATIANMEGHWVSGYAAGATLNNAVTGGIIDPAIVN